MRRVASYTIVYCGQTAGWIKIVLGTKLGLSLSPGDLVVFDGDPVPLPGAGHIVLDGFRALRERGTAPPPLLGPCLLWPRSPISATAELSFYNVSCIHFVLFSMYYITLILFALLAL